MLKFKASELITSAMSLADLTNSSFITSKENRTFINIAFRNLYQKAIDCGELFYLKTIELKEPKTELPNDFYQLYSITANNNPINRKNKNDNDIKSWYSLENNSIILNRVKGTIIMKYFPTPFSLDLEESGDVELTLPNNFYYEVLLYNLAKYYKIKQNADYSGIQDLLDEAINAFYDSLSIDINEYPNITNVYERGWNYGFI